MFFLVSGVFFLFDFFLCWALPVLGFVLVALIGSGLAVF